MDRQVISKAEVRSATSAARSQQPDKDHCSRQIIDRVVIQPEYQAARSVLWYVHIRDEVRTHAAIVQALTTNKKVVVPYCVNGHLQLFHLESMNELVAGAYGILEPDSNQRTRQSKQVAAESIDTVIVPGVGFDPKCRRIGHGKGYYDRTLSEVRNDTALIGIAYESQIVAAIPTEDHDRKMDIVVTEQNVYRRINETK